MKAVKAWIGPEGMGVWAVNAAKYEALWSAADWPTRFLNDQKRAEKEWQALYDGGQ